jgi:hypothetical protein
MGVLYGRTLPQRERVTDDESGAHQRDPRSQLAGNIFPAADQARAITGTVWWGDTGLSENPIDEREGPRFDDAGRDTVADGGPRVQFQGEYGMWDARDTFRYRFLNSLNLGKLIRPYRATVGNGRSDMMPAAEAVNRLTLGYPATPAVSNRPGGRLVAGGRVTRWPLNSLIWKPMGNGNTEGN